MRGDTSLKAGKQVWVHINVPLEKPALRLVCVRVCQIWQPNSGKAAAAPTPWVQAAARLSVRAHSTYIHIHVVSHADQHRQKMHSPRTNSTSGLILFPSLANQDESPLAENIYLYTHNIDSFSCWSQTCSVSSLSSRVLNLLS